MSRLIETIKLQDGRFYNLGYHQARMTFAMRSLFGDNRSANLENLLEHIDHPTRGLYKCRIVYDATSRNVSFEPYSPRQIRSVRAIRDNDISYSYKFEDRSALNRLFSQRGDCDDVLIIQNDRVTDCSYSNIVFRRKSEWFTSDTPLLEGTMRQKLIDENKIRVREILQRDIRSFESFKVINAMLEFQCPEIEVSRIVF